MSEATPRFQLPLIIPGQAQKELFHNEALVLLDAALHAAVEGEPRNDPVDAPVDGETWICGPAPTAAWAGKADHLAMWTAGGWRFVAPAPGMRAWSKTDSLPLHWDGSAWSLGALICSSVVVGGQQVLGERQPAVATPSGGTVIDAEARAAISSLSAALKSHGLID